MMKYWDCEAPQFQTMLKVNMNDNGNGASYVLRTLSIIICSEFPANNITAEDL